MRFRPVQILLLVSLFFFVKSIRIRPKESNSNNNFVVIETGTGKVRGSTFNNVTSFKGIPFAVSSPYLAEPHWISGTTNRKSALGSSSAKAALGQYFECYIIWVIAKFYQVCY
jgi:hypothetical protein